MRAIGAVTACMVVALSAANLATAATIEKTLSCETALQAQRPVVWVQANVATKRNAFAGLQVYTKPSSEAISNGKPNAQPQQLALSSAKGGFGVDSSSCVTSHRSVPFGALGMPPATTITSTFLGSFWQSCIVDNRARADRALLHVRITLSDGVATRAELALRNEATGKPVGYVIWTPKRIASWFASGCNPYH